MKRTGLTIIEIMIAVALTVILFAVAFVYMKPVQLLANGRNSQRQSHVSAIAAAIRQNIADNRTGVFSCLNGTSTIPSTSTRMASNAPYYNIAPCLTPYLQSLPFDPATTSAHWTSVSDYNTGYTVMRNASTGEVTVKAPAAELGKVISTTQ